MPQSPTAMSQSHTAPPGGPGPGVLHERPPLIDHHCHGVLRGAPDRAAFEALLTESDAPAAPGTTFFDTQLGFAVRRLCPPLLGLEPHCPPERYLARRRELGPEEATRRLLRSTGIGTYLVDTGLPGDLTGPVELAALADAEAREVVRLEALAERTADATAAGTAGPLPEAGTEGPAGSTAGSTIKAPAPAPDPEGFLAALGTAVRVAARTAAGFKSVAAYRHGLRLAPEPPSTAETARAAAVWLAERRPGDRVRDPVLLRHLIWSALDTGLPLQLHTGFGDPDLRLREADPLLLTDFIRAVGPEGGPLVLLHGYPFHRGAGYLAHVYPQVYADVGLALTHTGARASAVLAEALELTPFGKLLFSTDAYGLPELYVVGAHLHHEALDALLTGWVTTGAWSERDALRVARLIGAENALRLYGGPASRAAR